MIMNHKDFLLGAYKTLQQIKKESECLNKDTKLLLELLEESVLLQIQSIELTEKKRECKKLNLLNALFALLD